MPTAVPGRFCGPVSCARGVRAFLEWRTGQEVSGSLSGADNELLVTASSIAKRHHERWDGTGYPDGLRGEEIPLAARIVSLADVYDALRSVRPYKPAYPRQRALEVMRSEARANAFDPMLYDAFEKAEPEFDEIHRRIRDDAAEPAAVC